MAEQGRAGDMGWEWMKEPQQILGERNPAGPVSRRGQGQAQGERGRPAGTAQGWGWGIQRSWQQGARRPRFSGGKREMARVGLAVARLCLWPWSLGLFSVQSRK